MKLAIILTNDWEIWGNGKGDYFAEQKEPLLSLLKCFDSYKAKLTVFAEVVQQLNSLKQVHSDDTYRKIATDWNETIVELVNKGHDVQLHIHPQIINSDTVNYDNWSISSLQKPEMLELIIKCKNQIEGTIKKFNQNYNCIAFRAGGYAIQPSKSVIDNLLLAGIKCDSSVTKGLYDSYYNFKHAYSHYFPWFSNSDICLKTENDDSILEIPIFSVSKLDSPALRVLFPQLYYILFHSCRLSKGYSNWLKWNKIEKNKMSLKDKYSAEFKNSILKLVFSKVMQPSSLQFDYDKIPANVLINYLKIKWKKIVGNSNLNQEKFNNCYIPIVLIGHVKEFHSTYNIDQFLNLLSVDFSGNYEFLTISEFYNHFRSNSQIYSELDNYLKTNNLL